MPPACRRPTRRAKVRSHDECSSDAFSDYYSEDEYSDTCVRERSCASSRTFSVGRDLSRSAETRIRSRSGCNRNVPRQEDSLGACPRERPSRGRSHASLGKVRRAHSAARSVANSEDYNELKDFLAADQAPRTKPAKAKKAPKNPPEREAPRPSLSRRRQPEDPPCRKRRKRVHLVPNQDAMRSADEGGPVQEVQRVRLECRRAQEVARRAQAECRRAKEESRRAMEESRRAKEESERAKEQIRAWEEQQWNSWDWDWKEEEEVWRPDPEEWPHLDEVGSRKRDGNKARLQPAVREPSQARRESEWAWTCYRNGWAKSSSAKPTNAEVRQKANTKNPPPESTTELRMLVKNIKTTKLRREFQKRSYGNYGRYRKNRDERIATRSAKSQTDPFSVLFAHLSRRVPEEYLKSLFEEVGRVTHFELWKGPDGQSLGRGKVTYTSTADANMAVKQLSGWYVHGRTMRVCLFRPPSEERGADPGKKEPGKFPEKPCSVIFSNCNAVSTEGFLRWLLSKAGTVLCFTLQRSDEGKSLGWGTCTFDGEAVARRAIERFNGAWVDNRRIQLELDPNPPKSFLSCVFFHNVTWTTTAAELKRKFGAYGTVEEFELRVKPNGRSLGMGTCRFSCSKEAKNAIASLDGQMLHGRRLYLCRYDPIGAGRVQASRPWENCEPAEVKEEDDSDVENQ